MKKPSKKTRHFIQYTAKNAIWFIAFYNKYIQNNSAIRKLNDNKTDYQSINQECDKDALYHQDYVMYTW